MAVRSVLPFLHLALITCWAVTAVTQATAPEILQYRDGTSSRQESGHPGKNVTGHWSWVDANGRNHRIWYIADEFGFQAFGDLVPPVDQEIAAPTNENPQRKAVHERSQLGRPPVSTSHGSSPQDEQSLQDRVLSQTAHQAVSQSSPPAGKSVESSSTASDNKPREASLLGLLTNSDSSKKQAVESLRPGRVGKNSNVKSTDTSRNRGTTKFMSSDKMITEDNSQREINSSSLTLSSLGSDHQTQSNSASKAPKTAKMISEDFAVNTPDLFRSDLPNPISGTRFVLVDRLQPPTIPKVRAIPAPIRPRPVTNKGPITVISGVHTSSRSKSLAENFIETTTTLGPNITRGRPDGRESIVPQPLKVEGNLNLENFFSPINLAKTTQPPFQLGSLDDYYYDYDYYDYPASELGANSTSVNASAANTTISDSVNTSKDSRGEITESPQIIVSTTSRETPTPKTILSGMQKSSSESTDQLSLPSSLQPDTTQSLDTRNKSSFTGLSKESPFPALASSPPQISESVPSSSSHEVPLQPVPSLPATPSPPKKLSFPLSRPRMRPLSRVTSGSAEHRSEEDDCNDNDDSHETGGEQDD